MNKSLKRIGCLLLSACVTLPLFSCGGDAKQYTWDPETRPIVFATEALDGNFNPFFATSGGDSSMVSMTQIGMLSTNDKGDLVCGENEPTVALSYGQRYLDGNDNVITEKRVHELIEAKQSAYTEYEFVIKNGIKFSDGEPLTIKDVLFNLYVYLDPAYTGSSTMYSTEIDGLLAYRTQDPTAQDESALDFYGAAVRDQDELLEYLDDLGPNDSISATWKEDVDLILSLFKEEVARDWTANQGTLESYEKEYDFEEDWEVFYFAEQIIRPWTVQGRPVKDINGKYITNITPYGAQYKLKDPVTGIEGDVEIYDESNNYYNPHIAGEIEKVKTKDPDFAQYMEKYENATNMTLEEKQYAAVKDFAIQKAYDTYTATPDQYADIVKYWQTGADWLDKVAAEYRTEHYEDIFNQHQGKMVVDHISGISTTKKTVNGVSHDVLKIKIKGIDPKAIYNFSFTVAPMHYYSGTFNGVDYIEQAMNAKPSDHKYGVKFNDSAFFDTVLRDVKKNKKPVGAGVYQVSNEKYQSGAAVDGNDFYSNNWVYFARNNNFHTVGSGLNNAKIKYLHYKVTNSDMILESLKTGGIDVGEPNATRTNINDLGKLSDTLTYQTPYSNGYGYVGINPKYVPDIEVRRAIMKMLNPDDTINYYSSANASVLYRSMSTQSWIYKEGVDVPKDLVASLQPENPDKVKDEIRNTLLGSGNYEYDANDKLVSTEDGTPLKYTFTIAGSTDDHPATQMFLLAAEELNSIGFQITVATDVQALKKLASGQLAVWAAAWNSTIDPDMYQVYHKDSKATSVLNWGYPSILADKEKYSYEYNIIVNQLSPKIMEGRKTNDRAQRAKIYEEALNLVQDLAVELPTYQRRDCIAYNKTVIDVSTINRKATAFSGVFDRIWEVDYV